MPADVRKVPVKERRPGLDDAMVSWLRLLA
jgi:hypothetical protein